MYGDQLQEKPERIHKITAERKVKSKEKLSGERMPKAVPDEPANESKQLKKSPAKQTLSAEEMGKPLEPKSSTRQQVLKSPTDKPKEPKSSTRQQVLKSPTEKSREPKSSTRQQVLKSPTEKPKIVYKIPAQYIRSGFAKPSTPENLNSRQPTTPEKIKSGQELIPARVPYKQQDTSQEAVQPSKQQQATALRPIVTSTAAQKAEASTAANKPSVQQDLVKATPAPRSNSPIQSVFVNIPKGYSDGCQAAPVPPPNKEEYQKDQKSFDEYICFYTQGQPQPKGS
ncbi:hypothetical protein ANCCAN_09926 [Ancylostoma caninum]|uniref:Uncharacterized protein n=1 Tax=Ancylostoma caninum TaxID=29170 RepID=A0A368GI69_ANCCA|nr:hypothetical protein ANCCAN_09926 [Ancylostoma caninum]